MFHKRLLKEFKENQKYVVGMVVTQWISLLSNVLLVFCIARYLELALLQKASWLDTIPLLLILLTTLIIRGIMKSLHSNMSFQAAANVKSKLRHLIFEKLIKLKTGYRNQITTGEAVQISTEGVEQLEIYFSKYVPQFFYSLLAPVTLFVVVGTMSIQTSAILLLFVPLIPLSIVAVQKIAKKLLHKYWGSYTKLGDSFLEGLQALTTLKIYQADEHYAQKMDEASEKFRKATMRVLVMQLNSISVMDIVAYGGLAAGIILSVTKYGHGAISFAQCFFIIMISAEFFLPLRLLGSFFHIAMNGNTAANKIFALLDAPVLADGTLTAVSGDDILCKQVVFGYEKDSRVLNDISFHIPPRQLTAIVGASGCGKSTITALLMKEQRCQAGSVSIGGMDIGAIKDQTLSRKITRISHDSYLFKGTLADNLRMGNAGATNSEMEAVLKQVDLYAAVIEMGGLQMPVMEQAANLSGGQKQRLALARAILHDSDIYIFDEAASNVDVESENKIMEVIYQIAKTKTVVLISHRLENVVKANHILVFEQGKLVEQGKHGQLLQQQGHYSRLYLAQQDLERYTKMAV